MSALLERLRGSLSDRYSIDREIGRGGMATVFLAEDLRHDRQVAIKVLHPELAASLGTDRFLREIKIAAQLDHPHILALHDSGETDGLLYYVMPYVEGESLRERLEREGRLPISEALGIAVDVADGLAYAHAHGVVHRDIKPGNILLSAGHARIADFGVARAVGTASAGEATATGLAVGTPRYMSPEQAESGQVDGRADTYALGCVLYEMLAGEAPFDGPTPQALLAKHAVEPVPGLRTTDPTIPLFVERAVGRALAKDPAKRFQTPAELAEALRTGTVLARVRTRPSARRARAALLVASVALVVGLLGWWISTLSAGPEFERLAVLPLVDLTDDTDQEYLSSGVHEALITELGRLGLSVTARATMARYRTTDKGIREIADELGVDAVIEGSLFRRGDSLEIATRLYDRDEREIWAASFDGALPNVVALYRGFARAIADQIRLRLSPEDETRLSETTPVNPAVYEAYLRGMHVLNNRRTKEEAYEAIGHFDRAVEQNPADALAYAGLALCYATLGHGFDPPDDAWPRARAAAERALRLDSTLAEAWAAMADYNAYAERDWEGAERAFRRANALNPSLAMNHYHYAWYLALFGRLDEAVAEHQRAQELDPLTPMHTTWMPALYWFAGDYERALGEARETVKRYTPGVIAHFVLGETAARLGLFEEAVGVHERLAEIYPAWSSALSQTYARAGRRSEALRILERFEAEPPTSWNAQSLALMHAELGNRDEALRWLLHEPAHAWLAWVATSQYAELWGPYRDDPRYRALMRRMNLRYEPGDRWPVPLPVVPPQLPGLAGTG